MHARSGKRSTPPPEGGKEAARGWVLAQTFSSYYFSQAGGGSTQRGIPGECRQEKEAVGGGAEEMSFTRREDSKQEPM